MRGGPVEFAGIGQVDLGDHGHVGRVEERGVFQGLVFPFGHREQGDPKALTQVVAGGADQVSHVLDEQDVDRAQIPPFQVPLDHVGFEVADAVCLDLPHGAPLRASRVASLSVSRSPTRAATRRPPSASDRSVRSRSSVLPVPGLETRFTTKTSRIRNRSRRAAANWSFFLRRPCLSSTIRGTLMQWPLGQSRERGSRSMVIKSRFNRSGYAHQF